MVTLLLAFPGVLAAAQPAILVLGDSLSAGYGIAVERSWPSLLARRLAQEGYPHRVINASISGETTAGGVTRLPALLAAHVPAVVVIALGANDGLRGLATDVVARNLDTMVTASRVSGAIAVVVRIRIPPNYGPRYGAAFDAVFDAYAGRDDVRLAPFLLEAFATDPAAFQADGLHPVAASQPRILDTLWNTLAEALAEAGKRT